jgi:AbiU2
MKTSHRTTDEVKANHIRLMGTDLGTIYSALWVEVLLVHEKWSDYVALFGTNESRIEMLNKAAPGFFWFAQGSFYEGVLLHIARLTDPVETGKKQNLTIQRLPSLVDQTTSEAVNARVQEALNASSFARDWRNRHIAHSDLGLRVLKTATPLEVATREKVALALASLLGVLNAVAANYSDSVQCYDPREGDVIKLLDVIENGLRSNA